LRRGGGGTFFDAAKRKKTNECLGGGVRRGREGKVFSDAKKSPYETMWRKSKKRKGNPKGFPVMLHGKGSPFVQEKKGLGKRQKKKEEPEEGGKKNRIQGKRGCP